jgi:2-oxoisovalerate dehydrogenase E1 component alpha subunit
MDSDGVIVDTKHEPSDVSTEEVITWYKNMLTGMFDSLSAAMRTDADCLSKVNIMDVIMFEAQRQGRLSFYMVYSTPMMVYDGT